MQYKHFPLTLNVCFYCIAKSESSCLNVGSLFLCQASEIVDLLRSLEFTDVEETPASREVFFTIFYMLQSESFEQHSTALMLDCAMNAGHLSCWQALAYCLA